MVLSLFSVALKNCSEMFRKFIGKHRVIVKLSIKNFFCKSYLLNKLLLEIFTVWTANNVQRQPPEVLRKKSVLRNFAKFTGKRMWQSLFFNNYYISNNNFIKKETLARVFSCEFCEISKNTFLHRTSFQQMKSWKKSINLLACLMFHVSWTLSFTHFLWIPDVPVSRQVDSVV